MLLQGILRENGWEYFSKIALILNSKFLIKTGMSIEAWTTLFRPHMRLTIDWVINVMHSYYGRWIAMLWNNELWISRNFEASIYSCNRLRERELIPEWFASLAMQQGMTNHWKRNYDSFNRRIIRSMIYWELFMKSPWIMPVVYRGKTTSKLTYK